MLVKVAITAASLSKPITGQHRVDQTTAGKAASAQIRLTTAPPTGKPLQLKVTIVAVPGEKTTSNNTQTYTVTFAG